MENHPIVPQVDPRFPTMVLIEVGYDEQENGGPAPEVVEDLARLENQLLGALQGKGQYVGMVAGEQLAQLEFYTAEDVDLMAHLKSVAEGWPHGGADIRPL